MKYLPIWLANLLATIVPYFIASYNKSELSSFRLTDGKELKLLCVWFPQTREEEHRLDDVIVSLKQKVDKILIGYGQTAGNPMFCYYLPVKKIRRKVRIDELERYRIPLSLCDYRF